MHRPRRSAKSPEVQVQTRVFKAGNSLAVRLPSALAKNSGLADGASVEVGTDHGVITIRKAPSSELAALIARITPANLHAPVFEELDGNERW